MSHQMITMLAAVMPEELLIDQIEEGLQKYKISGNLEDLGFACVLIAARIVADRHEGGPMEMMEDMEKLKRAQDLLDPSKS